jgi:signal peptidase I
LSKILGEEPKDWIISIGIALVLAMFIRWFIVELYVVDGPSMQPTLVTGERVVVNKFIYRFKPPQHGDVIVFIYPSDHSRDFIKRVIAVPGDTIEINDGRVFINDQLQNETFIKEKFSSIYPKTTVPPQSIFVMGDNRNNSEDSRYPDVGFVPYELIKGKAMVIFWPLGDMRSLQ